MSVHDDNRFHCREPWARPAPVRRDYGEPRDHHGELYVFGSLIVIWFANNTLGVFVVGCPIDSWRNRREAA